MPSVIQVKSLQSLCIHYMTKLIKYHCENENLLLYDFVPIVGHCQQLPNILQHCLCSTIIKELKQVCIVIDLVIK